MTRRWLLAVGLGLLVVGLAAGLMSLRARNTPRSDKWDVVSASPSSFWRPPVGASFQIQFTEPLDATVDADIYDVDLFETSAEQIAALQAAGRRVVCYVNVGAWEDWRPDKDQFPNGAIGNVYVGYENERWFDIRQIDALAPALVARFDQCRAKGFDGLEPDNIDGYQNDTGFPLTAADQLRFNRWLAAEAHARNLSIGLKNDPDQAAELVADFDWTITEDCFVDGWCEALAPFVAAGKPVFMIEYTDRGVTTEQFCPLAARLRFTAILKNRSLDAFRAACE